MTVVNPHFNQLERYLFTEVAHRVAAFQRENPDTKLYHLGIGDVTEPLPPSVLEALAQGVAELRSTVHGYGPEQGYQFLRQAIAQWDYGNRGVNISTDEIFVSDGAKSDCGNLLDLFGHGNHIAICNPVYPAYLDGNILAGRCGTKDSATGRWSHLHHIMTHEADGFVPQVPRFGVDIIYLCSPNNPTGAVMTRPQLQAWVDYANAHGSVILFDGAYESFVADPTLPRSIFELPGAKTCAIELRSFSKKAGFTGLRCGYVVVPTELERQGQSLHQLWKRRQSIRYNGTAYLVQLAAAATYTDQGRAECSALVEGYRSNAQTMRKALEGLGQQVFGGVHAPYLWWKIPGGADDWGFFHQLLHRAHVVTTPGVGFGHSGEGYIRLSAFGGREDTVQAVERIGNFLGG